MARKTRSLLTFLAAVFLLGGAGCGAPESKPILLRWATWGDVSGTNILQAAVDGFKKAHPGVEVRLERTPFGEYTSKLLVQYSAGMAPDVMAVNCDMLPAFAAKGVLADLKPYVDKDPSIQLSDYFPEAIDHYTVHGTLTAIPSDISPICVIYYNKKKFDEARLPYPKDDWDVDRFLKTAQQLMKKDSQGNVTQYGFVDEWPLWDAWVYTFGGQMVDDEKKPTRCTLDSPQAISGVQFRADLMNRYKVMPGPAYITAMGGLGNSQLFINGTVAMYHSGIWQSPAFRQIKDFDWDVVEFPKGLHGHRGFPMDAAGYGVLKGSAHPELAYELAKYLTGEDAEKYIGATGLIQPALQKVARSKVFLDGQKPRSKGFLPGSVKYGHYRSFDPDVMEWTNLVGSELDRVWDGTETAAQALGKAVREVNGKFFRK